jgi:5-formyltetrahydrofolate cyclo-ligase
MTDPAELKARLRAEARGRRDAAAAGGGPRVEAANARLLMALDPLPRVLSAYRPMGAELDPGEAVAALTARGSTLVLPVARKGRPLEFRRWRAGEPLRRSAFGVEEPEAGEALDPEALIVPLLAFDRRGFRLGYGGGFYDRTLAALRARGAVRAVGFAFAAQEVASLPAEPHDARLDLIVTEAETLRPEAG